MFFIITWYTLTLNLIAEPHHWKNILQLHPKSSYSLLGNDPLKSHTLTGVHHCCHAAGFYISFLLAVNSSVIQTITVAEELLGREWLSLSSLVNMSILHAEPVIEERARTLQKITSLSVIPSPLLMCILSILYSILTYHIFCRNISGLFLHPSSASEAWKNPVSQCQ